MGYAHYSRSFLDWMYPSSLRKAEPPSKTISVAVGHRAEINSARYPSSGGIIHTAYGDRGLPYVYEYTLRTKKKTKKKRNRHRSPECGRDCKLVRKYLRPRGKWQGSDEAGRGSAVPSKECLHTLKRIHSSLLAAFCC